MPNNQINVGFHDESVASLGSIMSLGHSETQFTYTFGNFFHPFVGELIAKLNRDSLPGMLDATWQDGLKWDSLVPKPDSSPKSFDELWKDSLKPDNQALSNYFRTLYNPTEDNLVQVKYFPKEIDVSEHGPYANYNWELFFHIPLTIAVHLSKTQRFAEAQRWFQQDTVESINEATQQYVLAANILGERPQQIPPLGTVGAKTFAQLKKGLGPIGDALVDLEGQFPFNLAAPNSRTSGSSAGDSSALFGIGRTLYFCIPRNDKLLGYWYTVANRLFKIRHCMNIAGIVRPLALFDPPLDPGMLVKAAAAGIDIGSIVSGLNQPIGPLRCLILIQKALELCGEVRNLGNALLSALEKGDAEHLALVRQRHEIQIQQMTQEVRFLQWKQAEEATESLRHSRATALERYHFYQRLLGLSVDHTDVPDELPIDRRDLTALQLPTGNLYLNQYEFLDLNVLGPAALVLRTLSAATDTTTTALAAVP